MAAAIARLPIVAQCFSDAAAVDDNDAHVSSPGPDAFVAPQIVRQYEPILHILPNDPFIPMDFVRTLDFLKNGVRTTLKGNNFAAFSHPGVSDLMTRCNRSDCYLDFPVSRNKQDMAALANLWEGTATSSMQVGTSTPNALNWRRPIVYYAVSAAREGYAIQYWLYYAYNYFDAGALGERDKHEGDWESVVVVVGGTGLPVKARFSGHADRNRSFTFNALQRLYNAPGSVWCWRGQAGDGDGPRMPLTSNQQNPISGFTAGAPLSC